MTSFIFYTSTSLCFSSLFSHFFFPFFCSFDPRTCFFTQSFNRFSHARWTPADGVARKAAHVVVCIAVILCFLYFFTFSFVTHSQIPFMDPTPSTTLRTLPSMRARRLPPQPTLADSSANSSSTSISSLSFMQQNQHQYQYQQQPPPQQQQQQLQHQLQYQSFHNRSRHNMSFSPAASSQQPRDSSASADSSSLQNMGLASASSPHGTVSSTSSKTGPPPPPSSSPSLSLSSPLSFAPSTFTSHQYTTTRRLRPSTSTASATPSSSGSVTPKAATSLTPVFASNSSNLGNRPRTIPSFPTSTPRQFGRTSGRMAGGNSNNSFSRAGDSLERLSANLDDTLRTYNTYMGRAYTSPSTSTSETATAAVEAGNESGMDSKTEDNSSPTDNWGSMNNSRSGSSISFLPTLDSPSSSSSFSLSFFSASSSPQLPNSTSAPTTNAASSGVAAIPPSLSHCLSPSVTSNPTETVQPKSDKTTASSSTSAKSSSLSSLSARLSSAATTADTYLSLSPDNDDLLQDYFKPTLAAATSPSSRARQTPAVLPNSSPLPSAPAPAPSLVPSTPAPAHAPGPTPPLSARRTLSPSPSSSSSSSLSLFSDPLPLGNSGYSSSARKPEATLTSASSVPSPKDSISSGMDPLDNFQVFRDVYSFPASTSSSNDSGNQTMNKLTSSSKPRRLATSTATDSLERMPTVTTKSTPTVSSAEAKEAPMTTNLTPAPRMNKGPPPQPPSSSYTSSYSSFSLPQVGSDKGRVAAAPTIAAVSSSTTLPPAGGSIRSQSETTTGFEIETLIDLNSSTVPDLQRLDKAITNAHTETGGSNNGSVGSTNCISSTSSDMKPSISPEGSYPALRSQQQQKEPHHQPYQLRQRWPDKSHISSGAEHTNGHPTAKGAPAAPPGKEHEYSMLDHFSSNDIPFSPAITSAAPKAAAQGSCAQGPHSEPLTPLHQSTPSPMMLHQSLQYRPLPPKLPQHRHQQKAPQPVAATNLSGMDLNLTNPVDGRTKDSQHCQQQESRLSGSNDINHWDQPPLDRGQPIDFPSFTPTLSRAASAVAGEHGKKEGTVFSFSSLSRDLADVGDQDVDDVDAAVPYFVNVQPDKRSPAAAVVPDVEPVSQEADEWFRDDKASMTNITLAATASESAVAVPAVRREVVTETNVDQEQKESSLISPPPPVISNSTATATSPSDLTKNIITNDNTMPSIAKTTATTNDPRSDNADEAATIHKVSEPVKKTKSDHHHHDQQQQQQPQQADQQLSRGDDLDHQQNQEDSSSPPVIGYPPPPPAILYSDDKITVSSLHLTIHSFYLPMHQPLTIELRTIQSIVTVAEQGGSSSTGSALSWQNYYQTRGLALPEKINLWPLLGVSPGGSISLGGGGGGNGIGISGNSSLSSLGSLGSQFLLATKKRATSGGHPILSHSSTQFQPPPGASPSTSQAPPHLQVIIQVAGDRFRKGFAVQHARGVEILKRAWRHVKESEQGLRPLHPARGLSFDDLDDGEKDENADEDDFDEMSSSFDEGSAVEDEDFEEDDELYGNLPEPGSIGGGGTKKRQKKNSEKKNQSPSKDKVEADFDPDDDDDVDDYDAIHDYPFGINIGHHKHLRPTGGRHSHGKRGGAKSLSQTKSSSSSAGMDYHNSWHSYPFADFFTPPPPPPHQRLYRPVSKSSKTAASEAGGGGGPGTTTEDGVACGDAPLFVDNDLNIHDKI